MNRDFVAECGSRGMTGCEFRRAPRQNSRCRIATTPDRNARLRLRHSRASESPAAIFNRFAFSAYQPFLKSWPVQGGDAASQHFSGRGCTAGGAGIGQEAADICRRLGNRPRRLPARPRDKLGGAFQRVGRARPTPGGGANGRCGSGTRTRDYGAAPKGLLLIDGEGQSRRLLRRARHARLSAYTHRERRCPRE
jgi:hypothetical protein